jgi:hypothetical protein
LKKAPAGAFFLPDVWLFFTQIISINQKNIFMLWLLPATAMNYSTFFVKFSFLFMVLVGFRRLVFCHTVPLP